MNKTNVEVPIRCTGVAVVLLKNTSSGHHVLLLKRAGSILRDAWCYIGGGIEAGEQAWEAALREIREETGITRVALPGNDTVLASVGKHFIKKTPAEWLRVGTP